MDKAHSQSRTWRQPVRSVRRRSPFTQGDLDGLCGVYAIINGLVALCPELSMPLSRRLFKLLVSRLRMRAHKPLELIAAGIEYRAMRNLLDVALPFIQQRLGVRVFATRLPATLRSTVCIDELWQRLRDCLTGYRVIILGVWGTLAHWTVGYRIGATTLFLSDSAKLSPLNRKRCTV